MTDSSRTSKENLWILRPRPNPDAELRLFCLPHAGGAGSMFCTWPGALSSQVEVLPVQLPGRENRFREPAFNSMAELVDHLARALEPLFDRPFVLFGHSMGAVIELELVRRLRQMQLPTPACLIVSGRRAPQLPAQHGPICHLGESEFLDELQRRHQGIPDTILNNPEILQLVLPTLRADYQLLEDYQFQNQAPLDCPIVAFSGLADDFAREDMEAWSQHTSAEFQLRMLPGGHFYLQTHRQQFLPILSETLIRLLDTLS